MKIQKKAFALMVCVVVFISICIAFAGCGDSSETEITETTQEETTQVEATQVETTEVQTTEQTKKPKKKDKYADYKRYLSDFEEIEGNGYTAIVSDSVKGDFTEIRNCALYTMKKAYKKLGTEDMGVFGYFEGGVETAFMYDSNYGDNQIYIYEDYTSPTGWQWVLSPDDWKYIKGDK